MSVTFTINDAGFRRAAAEYAIRKNKSDADVVNKAMRFWLPFAGNKVKKVTPGERKIHRDLRKRPDSPIAAKFKRGKTTWAGTMASAIIAARLKRMGRLSKKVTPNFWELVDNLVAAKKNSAHFLRAGFIPAYRRFSVPRGAEAKNHKRFKGNSGGTKAVPSITKTVQAYAVNAREGAAIIAPGAFRDSLPEVTRQFLKWLEQDTRQQAVRSGFY